MAYMELFLHKIFQYSIFLIDYYLYDFCLNDNNGKQFPGGPPGIFIQTAIFKCQAAHPLFFHPAWWRRRDDVLLLFRFIS